MRRPNPVSEATLPLAAGVLVLSAAGQQLGIIAPALVCGVLLGAFCEAVREIRKGRTRMGVWLLVVALLLLACSFAPVYERHWTPRERDWHRHTLWELGHVH
ncbi:MAG TPA: hypothetical protein VMZ71_08310 [Gemmataceae bacterium]|nr:hypothetical protein [Gemmataceae bacterium]